MTNTPTSFKLIACHAVTISNMATERNFDAICNKFNAM